MKKPYLHYFEIGAEGGVMRDFPVTIPDAVMMHDFAMTERHVIFPDLPLIARPEARPPPCMPHRLCSMGSTLVLGVTLPQACSPESLYCAPF